jgi:hypothetical protein
MLSTARNEFPEFPAALSFLPVLTPEESVAVLQKRADGLREKLSQVEHELENYSDTLPRVTLLESEYLRAVIDAELAWVTGVIADLRAGSLTWNYEDFEALVQADEESLAAIDHDRKIVLSPDEEVRGGNRR